jgi:hypothetical protein
MLRAHYHLLDGVVVVAELVGPGAVAELSLQDRGRSPNDLMLRVRQGPNDLMLRVRQGPNGLMLRVHYHLLDGVVVVAELVGPGAVAELPLQDRDLGNEEGGER